MHFDISVPIYIHVLLLFVAVVKINFDWAKLIAIRSFEGFCLIQSWNVPVSYVWWFSVWRHINNYITVIPIQKKTFKKQVTQSNLNQIFAQVPVFIFYDAISRPILKLDYGIRYQKRTKKLAGYVFFFLQWYWSLPS